MARKKNKVELERLINKVISSIIPQFNLDEAILYGSYAKGTAHENSDVDIAIVSPDLYGRGIFSNVRTVKEKTNLLEADLQLTAFSSNAFYNGSFIDPAFIREIKRTGKQIYTKEKGIDFSSLANL